MNDPERSKYRPNVHGKGERQFDEPELDKEANKGGNHEGRSSVAENANALEKAQVCTEHANVNRAYGLPEPDKCEDPGEDKRALCRRRC